MNLQKTDETDCNNYRGILFLTISHKMLWNSLLSSLSPYIDKISVGFHLTDQLLIRYFCIRQILEKKLECSETVNQLFLDFKKAYDSVKREVLYNIQVD
jgi:hypothetical protein